MSFIDFSPVKYKLDNGLTVLLLQMSSFNALSLQMCVKVGSADEQENESGLAHFHEHMLFKGTQFRNVGQIAQEIEEAGGEINAWTSFDQTTYHLVVPSNRVDTALNVLHDAIFQSTFKDQEIENEKAVILEEIRRDCDVPSNRLNDMLFKTTYQVHGYKNSVLGEEESIGKFNRDLVLNFYKKWYNPSNMVLVAVGDFDYQNIKYIVKSLFAAESDKGSSIRKRQYEPEQNKLRTLVMDYNAQETYLSFAWKIPNIKHEDIPAIDVLSLLLGQGDSSRLSLSVKDKYSLVSDIYSYSYTPIDDGLFLIKAVLPSLNIKDAIKTIITECFNFKYKPISRSELLKAKTMLESESVYQRETVQGMARKMGLFEGIAGGYEYENQYFERVSKISLKDVMDVAKKYLKKENLTIGTLIPSDSKTSITHEKIENYVEEAEAKLKDVILLEKKKIKVIKSPITKEVLDNGATILVLEDHRLETASLRAGFVGGLRYESNENNGINNLISQLLTRGTNSRSSEIIATDIESMAGSISALAGRNSLNLKMEILSRNFVHGFEIFADCLKDPVFSFGELEREKRIILEELKARDDNLQGLVFDLFVKTLYKKHPYRFNILGSEKTINSITSEKLMQYYNEHYGSKQLVLAVVGDVNTKDIVRRSSELFKSMTDSAIDYKKIIPELPPKKPEIVKKAKNRSQSHLILGFMGTTITNKERFSLELLSTILAGHGGRLFIKLRDKMGLVYALSSISLEGLDPGCFAIYLALNPAKVNEAVDIVKNEIKQICFGELNNEEINRAKEYLKGTYTVDLQKMSLQSAYLALNEIYGLGYDEYLRYNDYISEISPDMLINIANKYLNLDNSILAIIE